MLDRNRIDEVIGCDAYGTEGDKIGKVGQIYLDDSTNEPQWVTVNTGLFGTNESFIPLDQASYSEGRLTVPFDKNKVKGAPSVSTDGHISREEEQQLYEYYGLTYGAGHDAGHDTRQGHAETTTGTHGDHEGHETHAAGHDTSGPTTDDAMTLSEERLHVGTRAQETGRVRLRKYVVTEQENVSVPVRKERAVLEREPITEENRDRAMAGPDISEEEHEVTLTEEVPVVEKTATPVERVRLGTEHVTGEETVSEEVRKERVETEGDIEHR